jgi:hypothetical protein
MGTGPRKTVLFTALMTAWLALSVIFAGVFVITEYGHEHINAAGHSVPSGEDCRICLEIQIALRIIEAFGRLSVSLFLAGLITSIIQITKPQTFVFAIKLIALKVKLNC